MSQGTGVPDGAGLDEVNGLSVEGAAVRYLERGFRPIIIHGVRDGRCTCRKGPRCGSAGKHPVASRWGADDYLDTEAAIRTWYARHPAANVALLMGGAESIVVAIDVDGPEGEASLEAMAAACGGLPETLRLRTGRVDGGHHLIFHIAPEDGELASALRSTRVLPGVDIKTASQQRGASGGYIVVAPSLHRSGSRYKVERGVDVGRLARVHVEYLLANGPGKKKTSTRGATRTRYTLDRNELPASGHVDDAPIARAFEAAGWLGPRIDSTRRMVRCPWSELHTSGGDGKDSSTVIFAASSLSPLGGFHCMHGHCAGRTVGDAIRSLPVGARALLPKPPPWRPPEASPRELVHVDQAVETIEAAIRRAGDVPTIMVSRCGTGKTEAAIKVALERAATPYASADAKGERAPAHSKTLLVVPTTELAIEVTKRVRLLGGSAGRAFGVTSLAREGGDEPECQHHELAAALQEAGASAQYELCRGRDRDPCEHVDTCRARLGYEGDGDERIRVTTHAQLAQQLGWLGTSGLLIVDEPPPLLDQTSLTMRELEAALGSVDMLEPRYSAVMGAALDGLIRWTRDSAADSSAELPAAVDAAADELKESACQATGAATFAESVAAAHGSSRKAKPGAPPFQRKHIERAAVVRSIRATIKASGRVYALVWSALECDTGTAVVHVDERRGERVVALAMPNVDMYKALRSFAGAKVFLDATGHHQIPLYAKVLGYQPKVVEAYARDGCAVDRVQLNARVTRKSITSHGRLEIEEGLVRALAAAVDEITRRPWCRRVLFVTFMTLELALRAALGEDVSGAWRARGQAPEALEAARAKLGPVLARLPREPAAEGRPPSPDFGHYFGVRGIDRWRDVDAVVVLGDAYGQLKDAEYLGSYLDLPDWPAWYRSEAAGEADQCLGRLRTIRRTRPALLVAVGSILPADWRDQRVEVIDVELRGRPAARGVLGLDELGQLVNAAGGVSRAARLLRCDRSTMKRYLSGERTMPPEQVERLTEATRGGGYGGLHRRSQGGSENPSIREEAERGGLAKGISEPPCDRRCSEPYSPAENVSVPEVDTLVRQLGGTGAAADALGISRQTMKRYRTGERPMPWDLLESLRDMAGAPRRAPLVVWKV
ncbi:bifunctional DNA primase/polymerase [Sorangium sp. So ce315]|uniref:bifunctional DNA primase/polymerase n=1 Tax=Sorangium sp. So ce315 TaxID=3133299 RepID=UPI003F61250C